VFVCDNNGFAYSTPTTLSYAARHLADRAAGYGFEGVVVDGTDVLSVYREARAAVEKARAGGGPTMLELVTLRMDGHAIHDDAAYVPPELLEEWRRRDPLALYDAWLRRHADLTDDEDAALRAEVAEIVEDAVARAEASPWPDPATLLDGVYATGP
jgi:pyruvate dehydrogenase E1 component alpha subunit